MKWSVILVILLLCYLQDKANSSGRLTVVFTRFSNPSGKDATGSDCDRYWGGGGCDTYLKICVSSPTPPTSSNCPTKISNKGNSFSMNIPINPPPFNVLRSRYGFYLAAWDDDHSGADDLIDTFSYTFTNPPTPNGTIPPWTSGSATGRRRISSKCTIYFKYSIYCDTHYYGPRCDKYCRYTDSDNTGHYRCNNNGDKVCLTNWYVPQSNCTKYCSPRDDSRGHYTCDGSGDKVCLKNWYLPQSSCTKYCSPRDDSRGHYTCDGNGDKVCLKNWYLPQSSCTKYCSPRDDIFGHFKCNTATGDKICCVSWHGPNCTDKVDSSGRINVVFTSFSNPGGKEAIGRDCDRYLGGGQCDTYLKICVSSPTPPTSSNCPTKISNQGNSFSMNIPINPPPFNVLRSRYGFYVAAWDNDYGNDELIDTFSYTFTNPPTANGTIPPWTSGSARGTRASGSTIFFKYRIYCDTHYYGPRCDKHCQ